MQRGSLSLEGVLLGLVERFPHIPAGSGPLPDDPAPASRELQLWEASRALEKKSAARGPAITRLSAGLEAESRRSAAAEAAQAEAVPCGAWIYRSDGTAKLLSTSFLELLGERAARAAGAPEQPLSRDLNTTPFRIIQEALANVHKHADTNQATIRLYSEPKRLVLEVTDQGKGFDSGRLQNRKAGVEGLGVGITGMRERVRQLGGTLEIFQARPGTLIKAAFPITEVNDGES